MQNRGTLCQAGRNTGRKGRGRATPTSREGVPQDAEVTLTECGRVLHPQYTQFVMRINMRPHLRWILAVASQARSRAARLQSSRDGCRLPCPHTHLCHAAHVRHRGLLLRELGKRALDLGDDGVCVHCALWAASREVERWNALAWGWRQGLLLPRRNL